MPEIRKARPGEERRILSLYEELIVQMKDSPFRPTWKKDVYPTMDYIRPAVESGTMYVAEEEGDIVGAMVCNHAQGGEYHTVPWGVDVPPEKVSVIHLLAVDPGYHNRGIARALLSEAASDCRAAGDSVIRLDALPWNDPGRHLYESFGFEWRGDIPMTYPAAGRIKFSMYEYILDPGV